MEVAILSSFIKYRIGEMAKDFGVPTKTITNLVAEFFEKPKSTQQVLTEQQLNVLFDVMTQRNQISSIEQVFATAQAPAAPEPEAPKAPEVKAEPKAEAPKQVPKAETKPQSAPAPKAQQPAPQPAPQPKAEKPKAQPEQRKRERRVIDTSAVTVNADRFDDRVDTLVSERVQNFSGGKQKIGNKNKQQNRNKFAGN